jgi:hypothetical protein
VNVVMEAVVFCLRVLLCISNWQYYIWPRGRNAGLTALLMSPLAFENLFTSEVIMHFSRMHTSRMHTSRMHTSRMHTSPLSFYVLRETLV